jgi:hypothetical protein
MSNRKMGKMLVSVLALCGLTLALCGCHSIPTGTLGTTTVGSVTITASGAGIVKADAQKTTFKIKCRLCGYETEEITVDTPTAGKPYTMTWICPKCGHKQTIVIQIAGP